MNDTKHILNALYTPCAVACMAILLVLAAGCRSTPRAPSGSILTEPVPAPTPPIESDPPPVEPRPAPANRARLEVAGLSVRGQAIWAQVFDGTNGSILILGGIHGNEPISSEFMDMLSDYLERNPEALKGRQVVLVNRANPDGLDDNTRGNANGVDLNRNFPATNFEACARHGSHALSEPETRALRDLVKKYKPRAVVSVHGPLNCIDPDGGAGSTRLARAMSRVSPLPIDDLRAYPGSMGSYCGDTLGMAIVTYELDRKDVPATGLRRYLEPHLAPMLVAIREAADLELPLGQ